MEVNQIYNCDALEGLKQLDNQSIHCVVTSPPYWGLRNYKCEGQLGLEKTPFEFVDNLVKIFDEVWRVLRDDGTVWLNIGDTMSNYKDQSVRHQTVAGHSRDEPAGGLASNRNGKILKKCGLKNKELVGIPWRLVLSLQQAGWYVRSSIIWAKSISFCDKYVGSCMPESSKDRPTRSYEYIFLLTKQPHYFYDAEAIKEQGVYPAGTKAAKGSGTREGNRRKEEYAVYSGKRNPRNVWAIQTKPYREAHFATFPEKLVEPCIKAGTSEKGCCSKCGAPYKRIIKKQFNPIGEKTCKCKNRKSDAVGVNGRNVQKINSEAERRDMINSSFNNNPRLRNNVSETIGYESTCGCDEDTKPCVVLDLFMGSGTSAVVAKKLGRDYIGFELNKDYCKIAEQRIKKIKKELENA